MTTYHVFQKLASGSLTAGQGEDYLKNRLGFDISPFRSQIINDLAYGDLTPREAEELWNL